MDGSTVTLISSIVVAVLTSATTLLIGRKKATTDIQQVVNAGFESLITALRADNEAKSHQLAAQDKQIHDLEGLLMECQAERAKLKDILSQIKKRND